jgi:tRNA(adenine34) deaminase
MRNESPLHTPFVSDEHWMNLALKEAQKCLNRSASNPQSNDVPVGAICVRDNQIVGRGHNRREADLDPTAHAEILAIRQASRVLESWRLENLTLYVTLEPCAMCAGAIWLARVQRVVFGAWDAKAGACGSLFDLTRDPRLNHRAQVRGGIMREECEKLMHDFFGERRTKNYF